MPCDTEVIRIRPGGNVDKDEVTLKISEHQKVIWVSEAQDDYEVVFQNESPFAKDKFEVKAGGWKDSGKITGKAKTRYEYGTVKKGTTTVAADPGIIIDN